MAFAIRVTGAEKLAFDGSVMAKAGQRFWVTYDRNDYWYGSSQADYPDLPDLATWPTAPEAEAFAAKWTGHPWWCAPVSHELIEVLPNMVTVQQGWRAKDPTP